MKKYLAIILLLITACEHNTFAQDKMKFERIPLSKGLSSKSIPAIIQDKKGYLWFATQDGLNKYDGYTFKVYQNNPSDKNSLSNNNIFCLFEDAQGILWMGTEGGGLNMFDPDKEEFKRYLHDPKDPASISSNQINCITEHNGELWMGTWDAGITIFNKKTKKCRHIKNDPADSNSISKAGIWQTYFDSKGNVWISLWGQGADRMNLATGKVKHFRHDPNDPTTISHSYCGLFHEDKEGIIWVTTWGGGFNRFDPVTEKFKRYLPDGEPGSIGASRVWPVAEDKEGNLWLGVYDSGLNKFDKKTGRFTVYSYDENNPNSISHNNIWSLFIDRSGVLWIGTEGGGISMCPMKNKQFNFISAGKNALAEKSVRDVMEDNKGNIWFATWNEGINVLNPETGKLNYYKNKDVKGETGLDKIRVMYIDQHGKIWAGTYRGGLAEVDTINKDFFYYPFPKEEKKSGSPYVIDIVAKDKNSLWVSTLDQLYVFNTRQKTFTTVKGYAENTVNKIIIASDGTTWFGTNKGLFTYKNGEFAAINSKAAVLHQTIYDIYEDRSGSLWLATIKGLVSFEVKQNQVQHFTVKNGLPSDVLFAIECDAKNNLWISTNKGISKFITDKKNFVNYNLSDGINNLIFYPSASVKAKNGIMYFAGTEGVTSFDPAQIEDNDYIPPVHITGFDKFDQPFDFGKPLHELQQIELSYKENVFTFHFVTLNYINPEKNQYAYKMEGIDKDWRYCGTSTHADYSGLPPGKYIFRVKASNNDGVWNHEGASIPLIIHPPFWETWWFRISAACLLLTIAYLVYRMRVKAIHKRNIILEKTVKERTEEVVHQKEQIEEQKKEILDSIHYAKRIQNAILTSDEYWNEISSQHFVFFKPKDIVSGDFYWAYKTPDDKAIWVVADCTGHGVPGAFMSMIGNSFLNEIVVENKTHHATGILNGLRSKIIKSLEQKGGEQQQKDGMDLALCVWDKKNNKLEYAGANNPLYIIRNNEIQEFKPNKMPIGYHAEMSPFQSVIIDVQQGDQVYAFSDGFADQFGGSAGKKYKYARFKDFLLQIKDQSMPEQKEQINREFESWKGSYEQLDDVCIIGVRI